MLNVSQQVVWLEGNFMIEFNVPPFVGTEIEYVEDAMKHHKICGDGPYTKKCSSWMEDKFASKKVLLTTSGSSALEMAALLCQIQPGDEVIMPSFTFTSTANAFVLRGATIVFVDIRPDTMNIDEKLIEDAITEKTKAIVPVHYAGVACEMDTIMEIAKRHHLLVVEDAAQGVMSTYKGKALGTIGDMGCFSFHETKNYSMGEGGAILLQKKANMESAEILREKGTNRSKFFRGQVDKYTWVNYGSSYLPSEINAAYLWGELEHADEINQNRLATWNHYHQGLEQLENDGFISRPIVPKECVHNAHMYYIKTADLEERTALIDYLREHDIQAVFHYIPLHSAEAGKKFGRFSGEDRYTTRESERLVRLPMYYGMKEEDCEKVITVVREFYTNEKHEINRINSDRNSLNKSAEILNIDAEKESQRTKKKLAIIGANSFQNPLILKAKELGYETHVFAWECGDVGEKTADYFYPISIVEKEQILEKCKEIGIDGITSIASDLATVTVNYVAEQMHLSGNTTECTLRSTNKYLMRETFKEHGVSTPGFLKVQVPDGRTCRDTQFIENYLENVFEKTNCMNFPLIVKPTDRSGSRAVTKVENKSELQQALKDAVEVSFEKAAIIEEYIDGKEFSMEGITYHGKHHFLTATRKSTTGAPHFIENGHIEPAGISEEMMQKIQIELAKALDALGVTDSATHSEFKITPDGEVRIIEIGARMGGDCIGSDLVYLSTGYDFVRMVIEVAMGVEPDLKREKEPENALIRFVFGQNDLDKLKKVECEAPQLLKFVSKLEQPGSHQIVDSSSRLGYYILSCKKKDKINWLLNEDEKYEV